MFVHPTHRHINCSSFKCGCRCCCCCCCCSCCSFIPNVTFRVGPTPFSFFPLNTRTHLHPSTRARPISTNQPTDRRTERQTTVNLDPKDWKHSVADCCRVMLCMGWCSIRRITLTTHFTHPQAAIKIAKSSKVQTEHFNRQSVGWRATRRMFIIRSACLLCYHNFVFELKAFLFAFNLISYQFASSEPSTVTNSCEQFNFNRLQINFIRYFLLAIIRFSSFTFLLFNFQLKKKKNLNNNKSVK